MAGASEQAQRAEPQPTVTGAPFEWRVDGSARGDQLAACLPDDAVMRTVDPEPSIKLLRSTGLPIAPTIVEPFFWAAPHTASMRCIAFVHVLPPVT